MRLLGVKEAAIALNVSVPTLRRLYQEGKISYVRIGRKVMFLEPQLMGFIKSRVVEAA